jgi:hypothetical protein
MQQLDPTNPVARVLLLRCRIHPDTVERIKKELRPKEQVPIATSAPHMPDTLGQRIVKQYY